MDMVMTPTVAPAVAEWPVAGTRSLSFAAGEHIFHEGDNASSIYEVIEGVVVLYKTTIDGGRQLLAVRLKGELLAVSSGEQHFCSALAVRFSRLKSIARSTLDCAMETDPKIAKRLLRACASELTSTREQLMVVGSRSALGRVAAHIIDIANRTGNGGPSVTLPLTRSEMGDYLGLTIETVSRAISKLKSMKIIALPRSEHVIILDRARLSSLASGNNEGASRGRLMS